MAPTASGVFQYLCVGLTARLPITSFGILAKSSIRPIIVTLGLPWGSPTETTPKEMVTHLVSTPPGGAVARAPFYQPFHTYTSLSMAGCIQRYNLLAESIPSN